MHRNVVPESQAELSAGCLGQMWQLALEQAGGPGPASVSCRFLADGMTPPGEVAALMCR